MNEAERITQNILAEEALLGAVLGGGAGMEDTLASLPAEDFVIIRNQEVWKSAFRLFNEGRAIDYLTIADDLERHGKLEIVGGLAYLTQLSARVPPIAGVPAYADMVRDAASRRKVIRAAIEMAAMAYKPSPNVGADEMFARAAAMLKKAGKFLPSTQGLNTMTAAELVARPIIEEPWLISGYILQGGVNLMVGKAGSGKSYLLLDAALAVTVTGSAWGQKPAQAGSVLFFSADSPMSITKDRLQKLCAARGIAAPSNFTLVHDVLDLSDPLTMMRVENEVRHTKAVMTVFDAAARYMGAYDENSAADVSRFMGSMRTLANDLNTAPIIAHHSPKSDVKEIDMARGSGDWIAAADSGLVVRVKGEGSFKVRTLSQAKNRGMVEMEAVSFDMQDRPPNETHLVFGDVGQAVASGNKADSCAHVLYDYMAASPGTEFRTADLVAHLEKSDMLPKRSTLKKVWLLLKGHLLIIVTKEGRENLYSALGTPPEPKQGQ